MHKIVAQIGDPINRDEATRNREKLQYARVLLEVKMDKDISDHMQSRNENGDSTKVPVTFEWKLTICRNYRGVGYSTQECKIKKMKQIWVPKKKNEEPSEIKSIWK